MSTDISLAGRLAHIQAAVTAPQKVRDGEGGPSFAAYLKTEHPLREAEIKHQAMRAHYEATAPLRDKMFATHQAIRDIFTDIGLPIIDHIELKRLGNGQIAVNGWGMGEFVSHPQKKFIEAVMNGTVPGLENESQKIAELLAQVDSIAEQLNTISQAVGEQFGVTLEIKHALLSEGFFMGTEYTDRIQKDARELAMKQPEAFQAFRESLGDELGKLHFSQLYSRFYFSAVTLAHMPQQYRSYFDMPDQPFLSAPPPDMSVAVNRMPVSFFN